MMRRGRRHAHSWLAGLDRSAKLRLVAVKVILLMSLSPGDITARVGQEVVGYFGAIPGPLANEAAERVRDYVPGESIPQIGIGVTRAICRTYSSNPSGVSGVAAAGLERICRPYLDSIPSGAGPKLGLPFRGGQCDAVYTVNYTLDSANPQQTTGFLQARGPILGIREVPSGTGTFVVELLCNGLSLSGSPNCRPVPNGGAGAYLLGGTGINGGAGPVINSVTPCGVDDCGNPTPDYEEPTPDPDPLPPRFPIIIAPDVNIDVEVQIGPDAIINIDLGFGPIQIDPFGGGDDGGAGGEAPPGTPELGPVTPGGNGGFGGDDELGEPPVGKRWVGIALSITERPAGFGVIASATVDKIYPRVVGNVRLIYDAFGSTVVGTPVQIRSDRTTLWEEVRGANPRALRVNLEPGFGYQFAGIAQDEEN